MLRAPSPPATPHNQHRTALTPKRKGVRTRLSATRTRLFLEGTGVGKTNEAGNQLRRIGPPPRTSPREQRHERAHHLLQRLPDRTSDLQLCRCAAEPRRNKNLRSARRFVAQPGCKAAVAGATRSENAPRATQRARPRRPWARRRSSSTPLQARRCPVVVHRAARHNSSSGATAASSPKRSAPWTKAWANAIHGATHTRCDAALSAAAS